MSTTPITFPTELNTAVQAIAIENDPAVQQAAIQNNPAVQEICGARQSGYSRGSSTEQSGCPDGIAQPAPGVQVTETNAPVVPTAQQAVQAA